MMSKRTFFRTVTPLPPTLTREITLDFLHNHREMIDLNPLVIERHPIAAPAHAEPDEVDCQWYSITDSINYVRGIYSSDVTYTGAFHDLPEGLQTHCYAPMGLELRSRWSVGGSMPGEPREPVELGLGAPETGLYLREDVEMRCNVLMTGFVKKTIKRGHARLVDRIAAKGQVIASDRNSPAGVAHSRVPPVRTAPYSSSDHLEDQMSQMSPYAANMSPLPLDHPELAAGNYYGHEGSSGYAQAGYPAADERMVAEVDGDDKYTAQRNNGSRHELPAPARPPPHAPSGQYKELE